MRKKLLLAALLVLAAPAVWLGSSGNGNGQDFALGFGKQIAGGWVVTIDLGKPADILMTLAADGNVVFSGQLRPAGPDNRGAWKGTRYNTTAHGSWSRVGQDGIQLMALLQVQNNDGGLVFYEKVAMELTLNKAGDRMEGAGTYQLFEAGKDPLDPDSPVYAQGAFTETARPIR